MTPFFFDLIQRRLYNAHIGSEDMVGRSPDDLRELLHEVIVKMIRRPFALSVERTALDMIFVG